MPRYTVDFLPYASLCQIFTVSKRQKKDLSQI